MGLLWWRAQFLCDGREFTTPDCTRHSPRPIVPLLKTGGEPGFGFSIGLSAGVGESFRFFQFHPNLLGIFFTDTEVVAGNLDGEGVAHGGNHFYPDGLTGIAAHFH